MAIWSYRTHRHQIDLLRQGSSMGVLEDSPKRFVPWFEDTCVHPLLEGKSTIIWAVVKPQIHNCILCTTQILQHIGRG